MSLCRTYLLSFVILVMIITSSKLFTRDLNIHWAFGRKSAELKASVNSVVYVNTSWSIFDAAKPGGHTENELDLIMKLLFVCLNCWPVLMLWTWAVDTSCFYHWFSLCDYLWRLGLLKRDHFGTEETEKVENSAWRKAFPFRSMSSVVPHLAFCVFALVLIDGIVRKE